MTPAGDNIPLSVLSASRMYQDYARAFTRGTGLPLNLHAPEVMHVVNFDRKVENPFCALMAKANQSCAACYGLQQKLEAEAQLAPKTLKCFAGLCETAVPVRVGDKLIAFLQTGQILLHRPNRTEFNKVAQTLLSFGAEVDLKRLGEAYFNTRFLAPKQYEALIRLLAIFAEHLGECSARRPNRSDHRGGVVHRRWWSGTVRRGRRSGKGFPGRVCKRSSPSRCWRWPHSSSHGRSSDPVNPGVFGRSGTAKYAQLFR